MKKNKNKSPFFLRFLTVLVVLFLVLSIGGTILVNWQELDSRKENTAPSLFGWQYTALNETFESEALYEGDVLLAQMPEGFEEGMMVLCRDLETKSLPADGRFALARITFIRDESIGLSILTNGERESLIVTAEVLLGEAQYSLRWIGYGIQFMRTPLGFFSLILGPMCLLLLLVLLRSILAFRRHRKALLAEEETEEMAEEQATEEEKTEEEKAEESLLNQNIVFSQEEEALIGVKTEEAPKAEEQPPVVLETVKEPVAEAKPIMNTVIEKKPETAKEIAPVIPKEAPKKEMKQEVSELADQWIRSIVNEKAEPMVPTEPVTEPTEEKKARAYREMDADDILAQFKMELEEARLKTLSEEQEALDKD